MENCFCNCKCAVPVLHDLPFPVFSFMSGPKGSRWQACLHTERTVGTRAVYDWVQADWVCSSPECFPGLDPSLHSGEMVSALCSGSPWVCKWDFPQGHWACQRTLMFIANCSFTFLPFIPARSWLGSKELGGPGLGGPGCIPHSPLSSPQAQPALERRLDVRKRLNLPPTALSL